MIASFSLVHRWGRDVHCIIVGGLGSLTTRYDLVISCHGGGPGHLVVIMEPQKAVWPPVTRLTDASFTKYCLTRPAMCTVPDPSPRSSALHQLSSLRPAIGQSSDISLLVQYLRHSVSV